MSVLPYLTAGWIMLIGVYGIVTSRDLIHAAVCLSVTQSGTYVLLLAIGHRRGATAPTFSDRPPPPAGRPVTDPLVQAVVSTDIVVGAAVTALLLALAVQAAKRSGTLDPGAMRSPEP
ncbi:NADH-quinone oxidoreductase subunit K [Actinomadura welshii]